MILFSVGCRVKHPAAEVASSSSPSAQGACSFPKATGGSIDIPEDNRALTSLTKGNVSPEQKRDPSLIFDLLQQHWRKKFDERSDTLGHKPNTVQLIGKLVGALGCPSEDSFRSEFESGRFKDIKVYTDESEDPLGYKREKIPNYSIMNQALRTHSSMEEIKTKAPKAFDLISRLDGALGSLPSVKGLVFRGTGLSNSLLETILAKGELVDNGFSSSSVDICDAYEFLNKATNTAERSRVLMVMYGTSGKFLPYGQFSKEEEVLFPHGTRFKVRHQFKYDDPEAPNDSIRTTQYLFLEEVK
jgi:hypothetical protein